MPNQESAPTFLSLGAEAGALDCAGADEADIVFFVPPRRGAPLHGRARTVRDAATHRVDRTVEYVDDLGRRVAEVFRSGREDAGPVSGGSDRVVAELVRCVVDRFGVAGVRRFRTRITGSAGDDPLVCTDGVLQRYRTDHESVEDVAVVCTTPSGTVVGRAWVTVAVDAGTDAVRIPA